jgi:hypothetical protein
MADEPFLSRWSKRKSEARSGEPVPQEPPDALPRPAADPPATRAEAKSPEPLPPVESLTPDSDFTGFMKPDVDEGVKRQALRTLFRDPQFNVMDGLDTYIDDYSKPDPMPESWLGKLNQMARLGVFEEKPPKDPKDPEDPAGTPLEILEKPSAEQGFAPAPSTDTSDTPDAVVSPPRMPE